MRAGSPVLRLLGGFPLVVLACGGDDLLLPGSAAPAELRLVSGDLQEAQTGATLPDPLVVEAVDETGRPVVGSRILFRFQASTAGARVNPDTAVTDQSGRAAAQVRLGENPGAHPVEAIVVGMGSGLRVRFVLTAFGPPDRDPDPVGGGDGGQGGGGAGGDDDEDGGGAVGGDDDGDDEGGAGWDLDEGGDKGERDKKGDQGGKGPGKGKDKGDRDGDDEDDDDRGDDEDDD